jgi:enoyl-CoA hydratase/carnithine racemase
VYETIRVDVRDRIATIALSLPDRRNAYSVMMKNELISALDAVDADDAVGAVVVTGDGRAFCAGMDLAGGGQTFARLDEPEADRLRDSGGELSLRLFACTRPVIAAINGAAIGVGVTMTLPMDIRLASSKAKFGFVFAQRGVVMESCSSWFLPRLVGMSRAAEWAYTGRVFDADEALAAGLVRSVHEPDELLDAAYSLGREIVANTAPVSVALNRQLLWRMQCASHPMAANIAESRGMLERGRSPDCVEGIESFLEKRSAVYTETVPARLPDIFPDWEEPEFRP